MAGQAITNSPQMAAYIYIYVYIISICVYIYIYVENGAEIAYSDALKLLRHSQSRIFGGCMAWRTGLRDKARWDAPLGIT